MKIENLFQTQTVTGAFITLATNLIALAILLFLYHKKTTTLRFCFVVWMLVALGHNVVKFFNEDWLIVQLVVIYLCIQLYKKGIARGCFKVEKDEAALKESNN